MTAAGARREEVRAAAEAAAAERARYDELFELVQIGILVTDLNGLVREANRAAGDLLGADPRRLVAKPVAVFVPPEGRAEFRRRLVELARDHGTQTWTAELRGRDDARLVVEVTATPAVAEPDGSIRWVLRDVTAEFAGRDRERLLASEYETKVIERTAELEEQRALLEAVLENIPAGLVVMDRTGTPVRANAAALRVLRADSLESSVLARWSETEAYHLDGRPVEPHELPLARTLENGEVVQAEKFEVVVDGRHAILEVSTAPVVSASGDRGGALAVFRDVTVPEQTERAERDFVTNAAHELQSPLAAIVSAIDVLQAGAKDGAQRDIFLEHIQREADRLARLVRALLVLARSQIGVEAPRDELVALCPLLEEVGAGLRLSSSVELDVDCPEDLALVTNRELVEQALVNLAENAAKHTETGKIALTASELENGIVEIAVADTGSGIPPVERQRVFERFYRADDQSETPGFGLGLAIVRAVADALDGELELDATVGSGTVVRLRLSRAAAIVTG